MTPLRKKMLEYKRRNQRFDARINRLNRQHGNISLTPLIREDTGKARGYIVRYGDRRSISSYELNMMTREQFANETR